MKVIKTISVADTLGGQIVDTQTQTPDEVTVGHDEVIVEECVEDEAVDNAYVSMVGKFKIAYENLTSLHRNLVGSHFNDQHKMLQKIYDDVNDFTDMVTEMGIALGFDEISLTDALAQNTAVEVKRRDYAETFQLTLHILQDLITSCENAKTVLPNFGVSKLEEVQYELFIWANYKIKHILNIVE